MLIKSHSFWPTFGGEGECVNLFQIASDHFKRTHKPYRIAVDTPYWLFKNLDEESVEEIRKQSTRASNPNEKANLYRLMRYACHGIQVCLVFDGKGRPTKRGKTLTAASHRLVDEKMGLLKEAAQELGVAYWDAPSEAEAECANMLVCTAFRSRTRLLYRWPVAVKLLSHKLGMWLLHNLRDSLVPFGNQLTPSLKAPWYRRRNME